MAIIKLDAIKHVTLYTGNNGTGSCTCKCPCCSQMSRDHKYQGNIRQAKIMFESLPNLKQLYLLGNPDVSVDADFCNEVLKEAISKNIRVCFSTSGVGGIKVLERILKDIPADLVDYVSFSFDAITQEEMSIMKGINFPMSKALDGLQWAINNGYTVKVQPTLWSCNYQNTFKLLSFFYNKGVRWFTFHIGSLEANIDISTHQHLSPEQIKDVHNQISKAVNIYNDMKVRCPIIYSTCGDNEPHKWYCMNIEHISALQVFFTEDCVKATHAPIASVFRNDLTFKLEKNAIIDIPVLPTSEFCPFSQDLSKRTDNCCRYISRYWNY